MAERLAGAGGPCVRVETGAGYERLGDHRYRLDPSQPAAFEQLLAEVGASVAPLREVVYLWSLETEAAGRDGLPAAALAGCVGVLHLVQALARVGGPAPPRLLLLTRGAQAVVAGDRVDGLAQAALWGLARVIAREHPELRCCRIDLDPADGAAEAARRLVAELSAGDGEDEVAFRAGQRYTARLARIDPTALTLAGQPRRWAITERGTPDHLTQESLARSRPGPGEVEIQVQAAGLNFLDVMDVLGVLPFERPHLGAECAGRITAVGEGVRELAVGDEVFALAGGTFATHVTSPAALAVRRPANLSAVEAATVPVAFLTAEYALHRLGGLKAGQKVLIHAAAGGVGLAAVQIAQLAGADVFATASPAKHAYLRGLGVEHVFHSRTLAFAEEILRLTGGRGVDLVLNSLSSGDFIPKSLSVLVRGGCFLEMGKRGIWSAEQVSALRPDVSYQVVALERLGIDEPATIQAMLGELSASLAAGRLRPLPQTRYPLAEAVPAVRCMQQARHIGKIVLEVPPSLDALVRADASYLITGGLGGLGLLTAQRLVERGARHLVLLGRSAPSEAVREGIAGLERTGAAVVVVQADVSVEAEVARVLEETSRALPPLRGIIHAAGALDDSVLLNQSRERFARVLAAKVTGAWHLHQLTQGLPLDFFVLYSSAAVLLGPAGQGNHAAANAFLDALAFYRQARGLPGVSINWGAWGEVGAAVRRGVLERAADRGLGVIDPGSGLAALERIVGLGKAQVGVVPADWSRLPRQGGVSSLLSRLVSDGRPGARIRGERERASDWSARIRAAVPGERAELLVGYVQGQVARVLGLGSGQLPERRTGFFELGMDSLMAVELRNRLQTDLGGLTLSATVVFDHPTVEALAEHLAATLLGTAVAAETPAPIRSETPVPTAEPIAIVGLSCRLPGGEGPDGFWQLLHEGREAMREVPPERWDVEAYYDPDPDAPGKMYARRGAFLERIDQFDPAFFGIAPREAVSLDPQQRLLLETAWEALEQAGLSAEKLAGGRTGVYVGICGSDYAGLLRRLGEEGIDAYLGTGTSPAAAAGRLSYVLGLQGPCVAIDTACSSSLVAVSQACDALRAGRCDAALVGGVNAMVVPEAMIAACEARMLSPEGRCKTFDAAADGFARGEGCGVVVLKRLSTAQRDGDRVLALIRGSAVNQDGRSSGLTVPNGPAQQAVVREALAVGGVASHEVGYVEAHGTGTSLGDPIEVQALAAALGDGRDPDHPLLIGSLKTNIGHLEAAAGIAGLIKVVLALQHEEIPRHLHFRTPNPHIPWAALPVKVAGESVPWPRGAARRIAGVSSFGFSGTNAHVVLEETPAPVTAAATTEVERPLHVLTLSARTEPALSELLRQYERYLDTAAAPLSDICYTANAGRSHFEVRLVLVAATAEQALQQLAAAATGWDVPGVFRGGLASAKRPKVAWLFPGQGSQYSGMGRQLFDTQPTFRKTLLRCEELLRPYLPRPLTEVLYPKAPDNGVAGLLERTEYTQPALFALEYALAQLWQSWGLSPDVVLGHGVGEYVAACVAGVFALEDGLRLIAERGRMMGALPPGGAMAVVRTDAARTRAAIEPYADRVALAALNGPANTVISGASEAIAAVRAALERQGIVSVPLAVTHAFHSPLLEPMLDAFEGVARKVRYGKPRLGLVSNLSGRLFAGEEAPDASYWREQARQPVRFADGIQASAAQGCGLLVEVGAQPVLSGLARECLAGAAPTLLASLQPGDDDWAVLLSSLAQLYAAGVAVDWAGFDRHYARRKVTLPTYPFQRQRYWLPAVPRQVRGHAGLLSQPLLGECRRSASGEVVHAAFFDCETLPFLADHRLYDTLVVPGAIYAAMALQAGGVPGRVRDLIFHEPLFLDDTGRAVQLVFAEASAEGVKPFAVYSAADFEGSWVRHADGVWEAIERPITPALEQPIQELRAGLQERAAGELYAALSALGVVLGPAFQGVRALWAGSGEAVAEVVAPEVVAELGDVPVHPAVLDACTQVAGAALTGAEDEAVFHAPLGYQELELYGPLPPRLYCHAQACADSGQETQRFDLRLLSAGGQLLGMLRGLTVKRAPRDGFLRGRRPDGADWLYEVAWEAQAPAEARAISLLP